MCHSTPISHIQFESQEIGYHRSVTLAIDGYGNVIVVFEEVQTDNVVGPKFTPNSDFLRINFHLVDLVWMDIVPNLTILLVGVPVSP